MRLCIADPPYPPYFAERYDTVDGAPRLTMRSRATRYYSDDGVRCREEPQADHHPAAAEWDDPARHRALLEELLDTFDGWAIATCADGLNAYYPLPVQARLMSWHRLDSRPTSHRVSASWEPVILFPPRGRRARPAGGVVVRDIHAARSPRVGFVGAKPASWTRWVLDALGYDPDTDELVDMFPGSGAVSAAASQGVLL